MRQRFTTYFYQHGNHKIPTSVEEFIDEPAEIPHRVAKLKGMKDCCCYEVCNGQDFIICYIDCKGK